MILPWPFLIIGFRDDERTVEVDVDYLAELGGGHFVHGDALDNAGVVHKDVDHADLLFDLRHQRVDLLFVGHVADVAVGLDAFGLVGGQTFVHEFLLDVVEDDLGALACECRGQCEADAVGSARDKRDLAFQRKVYHFIKRKVKVFFRVSLAIGRS